MKKIHLHIVVIFVLFMVLLCGNSYAQKNNYHIHDSGTLKGCVTDFSTKGSITSANIRVINTRVVTQSNSEGYYFMNNIPIGRYPVSVAYKDYPASQSDTIIIQTGDTTILNIELKNYAEKAKQDILDGKVYLTLKGGFFVPYPSIETEKITSKYGFEYKYSGCMIEPEHADYNKVIDEYLEKRNGKGWKEHCDKEIEEMVKKENKKQNNKK